MSQTLLSQTAKVTTTSLLRKHDGMHVLSIATKIVPGRVCPRTRQQLHARACGFFFSREKIESTVRSRAMPSSGGG